MKPPCSHPSPSKHNRGAAAMAILVVTCTLALSTLCIWQWHQAVILQNEAQLWKNKSHLLESKAKDDQRRIDNLTSQNLKLSGRISELNQESAKLRATTRNFQTLEQQLDSVLEQNTELRARLETQNETITKLNESLVSQNTSVEEQNTAVDNLIQERDDLIQQLNERTEAYNELVRRLQQ